MSDEIESAKSQRTSAKSKFIRRLKEFLRAVDEDKGLEIVDRTYAELKESWKMWKANTICMLHSSKTRTASTKRLGLDRGAAMELW